MRACVQAWVNPSNIFFLIRSRFLIACVRVCVQAWVNPVLAKRVSVRASSPVARHTDPKTLCGEKFQATHFAGPVSEYRISGWGIQTRACTHTHTHTHTDTHMCILKPALRLVMPAALQNKFCNRQFARCRGRTQETQACQCKII